ncbi:MAG: hypothetical protein U0446_06130 [Dehalococcoidia bacterium]
MTYVAFDGDADIMSYRTLQSWSADPSYPFRLRDAHDINHARDDSLPESIIAQLRVRLAASRHLLLLVSPATGGNRRGILRYEINCALRNSMPIIAAFIGYSDHYHASEMLWRRNLFPLLPTILTQHDGPKYCIISPFTRDRVVSAVQTYDTDHMPRFNEYTWHWRL